VPQPLTSVTVRRAFGWGIVVLADADPAHGEVPDVETDKPVSATENGVVVLVRHAQDSDEYGDDDLLVLAQAEVTVRLLAEPEPDVPERDVLHTGLLRVPSRRLSVGDADDEVVMGVHHANLVTVSVVAGTDIDDGADAVRVDLAPAP
jgi:hypothetical protein